MKKNNQGKLHVKLFYCALLVLISSAFNDLTAQNSFTVKGIVKDAKGVPLPNANVTLKRSTHGTVTDIEGKYSISVPNGNAVLVISYAGFRNQEIAVNNQQTIDVRLAEESKSLSEVVFTGYSKQSKRDVTGAVSTISAEVVSQTPVTDVGSVLQGRVSGVSVGAGEGQRLCGGSGEAIAANRH